MRVSRQERGRAAWQSGKKAETLAVWWLRLKGFRIVARRFACPQGEVDIIARRGRLIIFVEVKARTDHATAAEAITWRQRQRVSRAAEVFLQQHPHFTGHDLRFDAIVMSGVGTGRIWRRAQWPHHIVDAWRPEV